MSIIDIKTQTLLPFDSDVYHRHKDTKLSNRLTLMSIIDIKTQNLVTV